MNRFLTDTEMADLVTAIQIAETKSSGEIRVHIDSNTQYDNAKVAFEVFNALCKDKTAEKNAVLFHINFEQRYLTIIGDEGIHKHVCQSFWNRLHDEITSEFSLGNYHSALKNAILETGRELKKYFPIVGENHNELPNEITFS
ncbi:MAG: TPM domain-containing protein [Cruoricaptor ignavus]|nr:TPM domain-containing protein [Cruoricaptor ignavus]